MKTSFNYHGCLDIFKLKVSVFDGFKLHTIGSENHYISVTGCNMGDVYDIVTDLGINVIDFSGSTRFRPNNF